MLRLFTLLLAVPSFFCTTALAAFFQDTTAVVRQDSLQAEQTDTTRFRFIPGIGSMHQCIDSTSILHNTRFDWTDAKYLGDLLGKIPGYSMYDLGEAGKFNHLTAFGLHGQSIPILLDGRPISDPYFGTMNLYDIPIEAIEQIEILDGMDAIMYGTLGSAINIVTRQYNNNRPITKLRYLQGPFEYGLTDGFFAQNVARGTNVMVGVQRHVSDGRFDNSAYDSWNFRSQLRYNYSDRMNLALSYFYNSAENGINGGIDTASPSLFDDVTALVNNEDAAENTSRHDLSLTGIARLFGDSSNTTQFSIYYTETERAYNIPDSLSELTITAFKGLRVTQQLNTGLFVSSVGLDVQKTSISAFTPTAFQEEPRGSALYVKTRFRLSDKLYPLASVRVENTENSTNNISYALGFKAVYNTISLYAEYASFKNSRQGTTATIQYSLSNNSFITISGFQYTTDAQLLQSPANTRPFTSAVNLDLAKGFYGQILLPWNCLEGIGSWMFTESPVTPKWSGTGELAYRDIVLKDVMELRTGVRFKYASAHQTLRFNPQYGLYDEFSAVHIDQRFTLDFFAVAHLGDAYLTLSVENLLDKEYMTVSRYPMPGRTFRFGFNWTFFD